MTLTGKIFSFLTLGILLLASSATYSQGSLSGVITDEGTKETLIGATVVIVGTYKGSATDIDGKYTIADINIIPEITNVETEYQVGSVNAHIPVTIMVNMNAMSHAHISSTA